MRYLKASAAVLGAAMTFSFTPLGRTARAAENKSTVVSILDRNTIAPRSSSFDGIITYSIERYGGTKKKPTLLDALAQVNLLTCKEIAEGAWTNTSGQDCGTVKCGEVTTGTITGQLANGFCPGTTFTFAAIYYEWTAHNNQRVTDTINPMWTGEPGYGELDTFGIFVPVVRPDRETTAFMGLDNLGRGLWKQTLFGPPDTDPNFDFSGEKVQEMAAGQAGPDMCWFPGSHVPVFEKVTPFPDGATVKSPGNTYSPDIVGYPYLTVCYYRQHSPTFKKFHTCGTRFEQEMGIHAPSDGPPFDPPKTYTPYGSTNTGDLNELGASITRDQVTSIRAGIPKTEIIQVCPRL